MYHFKEEKWIGDGWKESNDESPEDLIEQETGVSTVKGKDTSHGTAPIRDSQLDEMDNDATNAGG